MSTRSYADYTLFRVARIEDRERLLTESWDRSPASHPRDPAPVTPQDARAARGLGHLTVTVEVPPPPARARVTPLGPGGLTLAQWDRERVWHGDHAAARRCAHHGGCGR